MKKLPVFFILFFFVSALFAQDQIDFVDVNHVLPDTLRVRFNIRDKAGNKKYIDIENDTLKFYENSRKIESGKLTKLDNRARGDGNIPENITVSLLVDRSKALSSDRDVIKDAVKSIVDKVPGGCVFISFFGTSVSPTKPITKENFDEFAKEFSQPENNKSLYNALYAKLNEFAGSDVNLGISGYKQNADIAARAQQTKNYLIVLTDGNDSPPASEKNIRLNELNDYADEMKTEIKIFAVRYGREREVSQSYTIDDILKSICNFRDVKPELRGDFFKASPDSVLVRMETVMKDIEASYALSFVACGKTYAGEGATYTMELGNAKGEKTFIIGAQERPLIMPPCGESGSYFSSLFFGLFIGILFFMVIFIILQMIIPSIRNAIFKSRYYKKYVPAQNELAKICGVCRGKINEGDPVVDCCDHIIHERCWVENGYKCPEYGQNCKKGKQPFFDINNPFAKENRQSYLSWVLYGLLGGLITWFIYMLLFHAFPNMFAGFSDSLTQLFYRGYDNLEPIVKNRILSVLRYKIPGLLTIGLLLGFILSFLFCLLNEYRKKDFKVYMSVLVRAVIGMAAGFVSFLLGIIIMLLIAPSPDTTSWWLYSIPAYLLFGASIGVCLSIKSTISWKLGLLGGVISILIGFFILYAATTLLKEYGTMLTFMVYGAGLGFSIATVRSYAEHYFLRIKSSSSKERDIAIHKWMNAAGGSSTVTIGTISDCEIQMNWDKSNNIAKRHVELFYDKNKKTPMLRALEEVMVNERNVLKKNGLHQLYNGDTFKIGNTTFLYFERD